MPALPEQDHHVSLPTASELPATVRSLLATTCDSARLVTLQLDVPGCPELATTVRRPARDLRELAVWATRLPPARWHDGLVLVASAAQADPERRSAVEQVAVLVGELVAADGRATQAEALARRALELAGVDPLTQLGNRRTWQRALDDEARRAERYATATTLVVVDLDGLKRINDERGHAAGDACLQRCAEAVRSAARGVDVVCRLGGDEFGLLAPQTGEAGAVRLAVRLRAALSEADVAASIGLATTTDGRMDEAWQRADADMYDDKRTRAARR